MKFTAKINSQRKLDVNWDLVNQYVSRWKPDTLLEIEIKRKERKVSDPLRRYYFAGVLPDFMEHLGYEKDEQELFHRQLKITYFQIKPDDHGIYRGVPSVFGNGSDIPISTKIKFIDWVIRKAAHEGVIINEPIPT
jgi:hypothetical protein